MEGFCRGCLIKYDEPMELLQYTEKNRRLFVYSTGLQVKRNDTFTFQLCKDCFLNMKQACKFKKNCRTSDKRFRNYVALKDVGDPVDFCTFLKNSDDTLTFRLPMTSGNSTPATQKCRDEDNESTCTSIRNFMTDILQGEEMPDTEAHIIKEVIEEEADVLDDSLDSHWLQDDMSFDTDFRLDISFSPFSTPHTVNNDHCYTPKQKEDQVTFDTVNTEKQAKILNDFTNAFKTHENIEELSIYVGGISGIDKTESFKNLKELCPFGIDESTRKCEIDSLKNKQNLKELISDLEIDEIDGMDTSDSKTIESNQNLKELCDFGIEDTNIIHETESNQNFKELCNFGKDDTDGIENSKSNAVKGDQSLKYLINNPDVDEIEGIGKPEKTIKSNQILNELIGNFGKDAVDAFGNSDRNNLKSNVKELCDFSIDSFSGAAKTENRTHKNVLSLKELCDFNLDSIGSIEKPASNIIKNNQSLKELYDLSLNSFDDAAKSGRNTFKNDQNIREICDLSLNDFDVIANSEINTLKNNRNVKEICDFGIDEIDGIEKTETNLGLPSLSDVLEVKTQTPDFDIPKDVIGSIQSNNDVSNSSINIEALINDKPCPIDTNLEVALKNTANKQFSLEDLLVSPPVFPAASAASTPTITNILFGEKLDTPDTKAASAASTPTITNILFGEKLDTPDTKAASAASTPTITNILFGEKLDTPDTKAASAASTPTITNILFGEKLDTPDTNIKIEQYIEPYHDVQGDIEIFEEFFQNDTKEFDLEDIIRENEGFKSENWKKPIAVNDVEVTNKENESKNIEMGISIDDKDQADNNYDTAVKKSKKEPIIYISHTSPNDKFEIEHLYCKLCKIKYDTGRALSVHFSKFHNIKIVKPKTRNYNTKNTAVAESKDEANINVSDTPNEKFDIETSYCKLCNIKYKTGRALSLHFTKFHHIKIVKSKYRKNRNSNVTETKNEVMINISDASPNEKFDIENLFCKLCKQKYNTGTALTRHFSKTHNIKIVKQDYQLCNNCGKFTKSTNFARHVKTCQLKGTQGKVFQCDRCLLEFKTQYHLEKHKACHTKMKRKKVTGKEFVCTICGTILNKQSNFVLHMRRHTKDYSAKCEFCDKGFYRQTDLRAHLRNHTGDTPFSCQFCPRLFSRKDVLSRHILIHLDERLFECDYCGLKCIKNSDLIKHIKNKSCRRVTVKATKKKNSTDKNEMDIDIPEEQEKKEEEKVEVQKEEVTVIYAKGSYDTIKQQLPFLETERSN